MSGERGWQYFDLPRDVVGSELDRRPPFLGGTAAV